MKTKHSLEENLERIADALEKLASLERTQADDGSTAKAAEAPPTPRVRRGDKGSKAAKPEPAPEPEEQETPAVTHDDVRESMRLFRKKHSKEDAVKILSELDSASITALREDQLAEAKRRFDDALAEVKRRFDEADLD